ncbi:MAG TPA: hypothetical protein VKF82_11990 [Candidatus Eremiobacteraceae bacterium]|nr:hypothetical protein [Candidatus Eremiobacteraceae bacterium]
MFSVAALLLAALLTKEQLVQARGYGCNFAGAKTVAILAQNQTLFGPRGREIDVPATVSPDGGLRFQFTLPPGSFDIAYWVRGLGCDSGGGGITILPGYDRRILVSMFSYPPHPKDNPNVDNLGTIMDWHNRKFFSGTLPAVDLSVSVVVSASGDCPDETAPEYAAAIDGDAYYVGYVSAISGKHTFLKLRNDFDTAYFALPDATPAGSNDQYVIRNITVDDLRVLGTHSRNGGQCIRTPSGLSSTFGE